MPLRKGPVIAQELKPKRISFLVETAGPPLVLALALAIGGVVAAAMGQFTVALGLAGVAAVGAPLVVADALVAYRKERYLFSDRQIVRKGGGILRDSHTELNVVNITHVQLVLPWPRHRLFGIGHVVIDSAGSGEHMRLRALADPYGVYDRVRALMRCNGFSLSYGDRLHEEQPPGVAVLREVGSGLVGLAVLVFFSLSGVVALVTTLPGIWRVVAPIALAVLVVAGVAALLAVRALDLRRRTYTVYDDAVVYTEGFLTRNNAFLPAENLADANTQQTVIDRILGIYDVTISCQGSGQEIVFRGLRHGPRLSEALESLTGRFKAVTGARPAPDEAEVEVGAEAGSVVEAIETAPSTVSEPSAASPDAPATFRMHRPRALAPYVLGAVLVLLALAALGVLARVFDFPLLALLGGDLIVTLMILGLAASAVRGVLGVFVTRFELRPRSVKRRYRLLQTRETEYSNEKLTGVVHHAGPLDRLFGTCSIHFWSIGASEPLVFAHVRDTGGMLDRALRQAGIGSDVTLDEMPSAWSLRATLAEDLPFIPVGIVIMAALAGAAWWFSPWFWIGPPALVMIWLIALAWEPIYYRRCRALFHNGHLEIRKGVFFRKRYHALYHNIKRVTTVRYPFIDRGRVSFQVAGHGAQTLVPLGFVDDLTAKNELIDRWFSGRIAAERVSRATSEAQVASETPVRIARPALANTLVPLIVVSVVLVPLVALLPVTVPWAIIAVRRRHYRIESYRVVARWGVIYARQTSIVFDRIDHIQQVQRMLNKAFGNGDIQIYTAGSSATDLNVRHIPDYRAFYDDLRAQYADDER